jgi:hypothetical protein
VEWEAKDDKGGLLPQGTFGYTVKAVFEDVPTRERTQSRDFEVREHEPAFQGTTPFTDIPKGNWAEGYVAAAIKAGVVKPRKDEKTFNPGRFITRKELNGYIQPLLDRIEAKKGPKDYFRKRLTAERGDSHIRRDEAAGHFARLVEIMMDGRSVAVSGMSDLDADLAINRRSIEKGYGKQFDKRFTIFEWLEGMKIREAKSP